MFPDMKHWFRENQSWSGQSPDLSPAEKLWSFLRRQSVVLIRGSCETNASASIRTGDKKVFSVLKLIKMSISAAGQNLMR